MPPPGCSALTRRVGAALGAAARPAPIAAILWSRRRAFRPGRRLHRRQEFLLADIGEGIAEVEVLKWFVKAGDPVEQFQKLCEVQSDKATVEITSRFDGTVQALNVDVGQMAKVGESLVTLDVADDAVGGTAPSPSPTAASTPAPPFPEPSAAEQEPEHRNKALATPAVRRLCREHNLDIATIPATGPDGRVLKADVLAAIAGAAAAVGPSPPAGTAPPAAAAAAAADTVVPISGLARIMVKTMAAANAVPTLTLHEEVVADELRRIRAALKASLPSLTYLPLILKAVSLALLDFPRLNAHLDDACTALTVKGQHNVAIAMDTPRGLMVPVVKAVQARSVAEIAADLQRLALLGAANQLGADDLKDGTIAISNIGSVGGTYATPLLVRPQVVIGAIGRIQTGMARYDAAGQLAPTSVMAMSWSADHRVVDGATIARFSARVKALLEAPHTMLLHTK